MSNRTKRKAVFLILLFACIAFAVGFTIQTHRLNRLEQESVPVVVSGDAEAEIESRIEVAAMEARAEGYEEGRKSVLNEIQMALSVENPSVIRLLKKLYTDKIVFSNSEGFHFVDIDTSLPLHNYLEENLVIDEETGYYTYMENGEKTSRMAVDVSVFQGNINWNKVAAAGVEVAYIRGLYRGYGNGNLKVDDTFRQNIAGALNAGLEVGVYVFSQAITEEELLEEANKVIELVAPYSSDCTIIFDVEKIVGEGRANELSVEERTAFTKLFCDTVAAAGYHPMIYFNTEMAVSMINLADLTAYDKWFAAYTEDFYFPYDYSVWQYSESGRVDGIPELVDLDIILK